MSSTLNFRVAPVRKRLLPLHRHYLKEWRDFRGLSQERAAERLGIDRSLLSKIENFKSPYTQRLLEAAAEAYGCEPQDLLMRDPRRPDAIWSITDNLKKATPEQREHIEDLVEAVLKPRRRA